MTVTEDQDAVRVEIFQGESSDLHQNLLIGKFLLEGLNKTADSDGKIRVRFDLTLDGTLSVNAVERKTGRSKSIKLDNALSQLKQVTQQSSEEKLGRFFEDSEEFTAFSLPGMAMDELDEAESAESSTSAYIRFDGPSQPQSNLVALLDKARSIRPSIEGEDATDVDRLVRLIEEADRDGNKDLLSQLSAELDDLLFYISK